MSASTSKHEQSEKDIFAEKVEEEVEKEKDSLSLRTQSFQRHRPTPRTTNQGSSSRFFGGNQPPHRDPNTRLNEELDKTLGNGGRVRRCTPFPPKKQKSKMASMKVNFINLFAFLMASLLHPEFLPNFFNLLLPD